MKARIGILTTTTASVVALFIYAQIAGLQPSGWPTEMSAVQSSNATGREKVFGPAIASASTDCSNINPTYGSLSKEFSIPKSWSYTIWTRMMRSGTSDKFALRINNQLCTEIQGVNLAENQWQWVGYQSGDPDIESSFDLAAGSNQVELLATQPGVKIDRVIIAADGECPMGPTGLGDNCVATSDTNPPVLDVSSPDDLAAVSNNVQISAHAHDEASNVRVQIHIDGRIIAELPAEERNNYKVQFDWDTTSTQNGKHHIAIVATDESGNATREVRTIYVQNGDTEKPSTPTNLKVETDSGKAVLSWNLSTDNIGVKDYIVYRNGDNVIGSSSAGSFIDEKTIPGSTYSYSVAARDAAGNTSRSSEVRISIPPAQDTQAPSKPENVRINMSGTSQISLLWEPSTDNVAIAGYDIYRSISSDAFVRIASTTSVSFGDSNLQPETNYAYYIIARDSNSNVSEKSATVNITTSPRSTPAPDPKTEDSASEPSNPATPIEQTGILRGRVTNSSKNPVSGVQVIATNRNKSYSATTNAQGVYRIHGVPAGTYSITFTHSNYKSSSKTVRLSADKEVATDRRLTSNTPQNTRNHWWSWVWSWLR